MLNKRFVVVVACVLSAIGAVLWWPVTVSGRVVNGASGEPVQGMSVDVRGSVLKPGWPVRALAYAEVTDDVRRTVKTDRDGRFSSRIFAGWRLAAVHYHFVQRAHVVEPRVDALHGVWRLPLDEASTATETASGASRWHAEVRAWPASAGVEVGSRYFDVVWARPREAARVTAILGSRKQPLSLELMPPDADSTVGLTARWPAGEIQRIEDASRPLMIAPLADYMPEVRTTVRCEEIGSAMFFLHSDDGNTFGWVDVNLVPLCLGRKRIGIDYRLGSSPDARVLVGGE